MSANPFNAHLNVYSHFSLLQATPDVKTLAQKAAADGLRALALTDYAALYGSVTFARACRDVSIKPIVGMTTRLQALDGLQATGANGKIVLLARNPAGYRSLCRLSSWLQADAERETRMQQGVPWELLADNQEGLIAIDGGRDGWLGLFLRSGDRVSAEKWSHAFKSIFGNMAFAGLAPETAQNRSALAAYLAHSQLADLPLVACYPLRTMAADERETLHLLQAIKHNVLLDSVAVDSAETISHWLNSAEMHAIYRAVPQALTQIDTIIDLCEEALPDGRTIWPKLDLPPGQTADTTLKAAASSGLKRYGDNLPDNALARLEHELNAITHHGFAPIFLIVADIARHARAQEIPISTRGSVANSLVAYTLGISDVDPLRHDLLFERFLNPARATLPDIDLDFCSRRRDLVLDYVRQRYGVEHVALVSTMNTLKLKSAVRATAKAHGYDAASMKRLTRQLPSRWHPDPRRRDRWTPDELVARFEAADRPIIRAALPLVGQPDHVSVHPGGVVITPDALTDVVPVQWTPKGFVVTQFDYRDVETIGLPKLDLLGIRALTVLADSAERVRADHDPTFKIDAIAEDDQATGDLLQFGRTVGVFQCESSGARRTLRKLKARTPVDLAVANAFFKPGPATGGMAGAFVRRYRGDAPVSYLHPTLEPILSPTSGVLLFQEQVLRVTREVAGLSWTDADQLRRGMSKFDSARMQALQRRFVAGCQTHSQFTQRQADTLWQQVIAFAGYGFNQGHALAYGQVSFRSAYLKTHYPAVFLWARLAVGGGYHHPAIYLAEAQQLGIQIRPPHVNVSNRQFTLTNEPETLWMGLGWVRDVRRSAVRQLIAERPFRNLRDVLMRVPLQDKEIVNLIRCGALDGFEASRAALLQSYKRLRRANSARQMAFDFGLGEVVSTETPAQRLAWEKELLGIPMSVHPVDLHANRSEVMQLSQIALQPGVKQRVLAARLPGWGRGGSFYIGDGHNWVRTEMAKHVQREKPRVWQAVILTGQWRPDGWGGGNFVVDNWSEPV